MRARAACAASRVVVLGLVTLMVATGGFVAGIRAGFAYNTFPLMNGARRSRPEILLIEPWWRNFFYNMATVQFDHRLVAYVLAVAIPLLWWRVRRTARHAGAGAHRRRAAGRACSRCRSRWASPRLLLVVPLPLAALHQAGAVIVFALAVNVAHALR